MIAIKRSRMNEKMRKRRRQKNKKKRKSLQLAFYRVKRWRTEKDCNMPSKNHNNEEHYLL